MNWWDYGHWITYIAHRIPNSNPFQSGVREVAKFFTAQDESSANEVMDKLGSKYVILDYDMANGKFYAMGLWTGESKSHFMENYDINPNEGDFDIVMLYHPEYYRSMCSRLYNFGGEAVVPHNSTVVISYEEEKFLRTTIKKITGNETFATYEEALEYLGSQNTTNYEIVGEYPSISPVPLEALEHYNLVYQSDPVVIEVTIGTGKEAEEEQRLFYVKIFEYQP
jgi:asparagine N-glycosylation enzyme membrane subunit Stt3